MKDRALRRHQDFRAKRKSRRAYNNCIGDEIPQSDMRHLENNVEKLKKVCVMSHLDKHIRKATRKPLQEMKHDITMREELKIN